MLLRLAEIGFEILDILVQRAEDQAAVLREARHLDQPLVVGRESFREASGVGHAGQFAIQLPAPSVIRAVKSADIALLLPYQSGATMPAEIQEGIDRPVRIAGDDHRLPTNPRRLEIALVREFAFVPEVDPVRIEDGLDLALEEVCTPVSVDRDAEFRSVLGDVRHIGIQAGHGTSVSHVHDQLSCCSIGRSWLRRAAQISPARFNTASSFFSTSGVAGIMGRRCSLRSMIPRRFIMYFIGIGLVSKKMARIRS